MERIDFKGGYRFNFKGAASDRVEEPPLPKSLTITLDSGGLSWEPLLSEGDDIAALAPLARLQGAEEILLLSPAAGKVTKTAASSEEGPGLVALELGEGEPSSLGDWPSDRDAARGFVAKAGLWWRIRDGLTGSVAALDSEPEWVLVRALDSEPHARNEALAMDSETEAVKGLEALGLLAGKNARIRVVAPQGASKLAALDGKAGVQVVEVPNRYPAGNRGWMDGMVAGWAGRREGRTWVIDLQEVMRLGALRANGSYDPRELVSVAGMVSKPAHAKVLPGIALKELLSGDFAPSKEAGNAYRVVLNGLMTGRAAPLDGALPPGVRSVTVIREQTERRFLSFFRPGFSEDSYSYGYASSLVRGMPRPMHAGLRGQQRYCISCGYCDQVCPVDLEPQQLWKLVDIGEVEEAASLGLMRCVECGLCTYVCPAKIEITEDLKRGRGQYMDLLAEEAKAAQG